MRELVEDFQQEDQGTIYPWLRDQKGKGNIKTAIREYFLVTSSVWLVPVYQRKTIFETQGGLESS